jgi:hypothetical protein
VEDSTCATPPASDKVFRIQPMNNSIAFGGSAESAGQYNHSTCYRAESCRQRHRFDLTANMFIMTPRCMEFDMETDNPDGFITTPYKEHFA